MRPSLLHFCLALASVACTAAALELGLRLVPVPDAPIALNPAPGLMFPTFATGWQPRAGAGRTVTTATGDTFRLQINSTGQRGAEVAERRAGERRLLFIGDSITYGASVPEEQTFVSLAGEHLRAGGHRISTINGGVPGYSTYQELAYQRYVAPRLQPDLVVLVFFSGNDFRDNMVHTAGGTIVSPALLGTWHAPQDAGPARPVVWKDPLSQTDQASPGGLLSDLGRTSLLARLLLGRVAQLRDRTYLDLARLDPVSRYHYYEIGILQELQTRPLLMARDLTAACIEGVRDQVHHDAGAAFAMVIVPSRHQVDPAAWSQTLGNLGLDQHDLEGLNLNAPNEFVAATANGLSIPVIDLTGSFRSRADPASLYNGTHLSPTGHDVAASEIARFLNGHTALLAHEASPSVSPRREALAAANPRAAALQLGAAIELSPTAAVLRAQHAEASLAAGDTATALSELRLAAKLQPAHWTHHARLADLLAARGDGAGARLHATRSEQLAWSSERLRLGWGEEHLLRGELHTRAGAWLTAETELRRAAAFRRDALDRAEIDSLLSVVFLESGQDDSAAVYLNRVRAPGAWHATATTRLATRARLRGDPLFAARLYATAFARSEAAAMLDSFMRTGGMAVVQGQVDEVVGVCEQLLEAHPDASAARLLLAAGLHRLGRFEDSVREARHIISTPDNRMGMARIQLAQGLRALGRVPEALSLYRTIIAGDGSWREGGLPADLARRHIAGL